MRAFFGLRGRIEEDALTKSRIRRITSSSLRWLAMACFTVTVLALPLRVRRYALGWLEHQAAWGNPTQFN